MLEIDLRTIVAFGRACHQRGALRILRFTVFGLIFFGTFGCGPKNVLDQKLSAADKDDLANSRTRLVREFTPEQTRIFDTAVQELKIKAMNAGINSIAGRGKSMLSAIDGKTVREAMIIGWQARLERLRSELDDMEGRYTHDQRLKTMADDSDSAKTLSNIRQNEKDIIDQLHQRLADTEATLRELGATPAAAAAVSESSPPTTPTPQHP